MAYCAQCSRYALESQLCATPDRSAERRISFGTSELRCFRTTVQGLVRASGRGQRVSACEPWPAEPGLTEAARLASERPLLDARTARSCSGLPSCERLHSTSRPSDPPALSPSLSCANGYFKDQYFHCSKCAWPATCLKPHSQLLWRSVIERAPPSTFLPSETPPGTPPACMHFWKP